MFRALRGLVVGVGVVGVISAVFGASGQELLDQPHVLAEWNAHAEELGQPQLQTLCGEPFTPADGITVVFACTANRVTGISVEVPAQDVDAVARANIVNTVRGVLLATGVATTDGAVNLAETITDGKVPTDGRFRVSSAVIAGALRRLTFDELDPPNVVVATTLTSTTTVTSTTAPAPTTAAPATTIQTGGGGGVDVGFGVLVGILVAVLFAIIGFFWVYLCGVLADICERHEWHKTSGAFRILAKETRSEKRERLAEQAKRQTTTREGEEGLTSNSSETDATHPPNPRPLSRYIEDVVADVDPADADD